MAGSVPYIEVKALVHSVFGTEIHTHLESVYMFDIIEDSKIPQNITNTKLLIILQSSDTAVLPLVKKCHEQVSRKLRNKCQLGYQIFSKSTLFSSLDIFPIEFFELTTHRDLVWGSDILTGLSIDPKNLRQECEFYLRTHVLKLKEGFIQSSMSNAALIQSSFPFILAIFKYLSQLLDVNPDASTGIIERLAQKIQFKTRVFLDIQRSLNEPDCGVFLFDYIAELEAITVRVDQLDV